MLYRKIASKIESHLLSDQRSVLIIDGARQIGKSYIIREVGKKLFPNYIEVNMEEDKLQARMFENARTVNDFYMALSMSYGSKMVDRKSTLIFIDEIQAYDHLLTLLKFLVADNKYTFIASGSMLGVALRNTSSVPMGSIRIVHMYPMDFEEFIIANGVGDFAIQSMRTFFNNEQQLDDAMHRKMLDLFRKYLLVGGLPAAVDEFVNTYNIHKIRSIQNEINKMYAVDASKYEEEAKSRLKVRRILEMVPSNLENKKKRFVYKDIENISWKRADSYAEEFDYLISAGVALEVKAISQPSYPLIQNSGKNLLKLYLNDVGILSGIYYQDNITAITNDVRSVNLGAVYETVVAQELKAHNFSLYYYDNKRNGEVDFLIDDADNLSVMPLEIKSGKDYTIHSALDKFLSIADYGIKKAYVLSNEQRVYTEGGITYMPIYYIMFFQH
jgi:predicted AAA+ superfamily ATPase